MEYIEVRTLDDYDTPASEFVGTRVVVHTPFLTNSYKGKYDHLHGIVERASGGNLGVRIDKEINSGSGYGVFWFRLLELTLESEKGEIEKMAEEITGNYKVAVVKVHDKEHCYALFSEDMSNAKYYLAKDKCGYHVVEVVSVIEKDETAQIEGEVVCSLDFDNYDKRVANRKAKKKIKSEMDVLLEKSQELLLYQAIAKESPEMAALLEQYKALGDV